MYVDSKIISKTIFKTWGEKLNFDFQAFQKSDKERKNSFLKPAIP